MVAFIWSLQVIKDRVFLSNLDLKKINCCKWEKKCGTFTSSSSSLLLLFPTCDDDPWWMTSLFSLTFLTSSSSSLFKNLDDEFFLLEINFISNLKDTHTHWVVVLDHNNLACIKKWKKKFEFKLKWSWHFMNDLLFSVVVVVIDQNRRWDSCTHTKKTLIQWSLSSTNKHRRSILVFQIIQKKRKRIPTLIISI